MTTKVTIPGAPPRPKVGAVIVDMAERRRERMKEVWVRLDPDEPEYRTIPVLSPQHRARLFSGFFDTDVQVLRSLIHPDDRKRFDVLVGADLAWDGMEDRTEIPFLTSDGRPLLDIQTADEALKGMLISMGIWKQPDESVISVRMREILAQENIDGPIATEAIQAAMAIITAHVLAVSGEVVEEQPEAAAPEAKEE